MPIRFFCQNCRQALKAKEDKVGRRMPCPKCKSQVTVPGETDPEVDRYRQRKQSEGEVDPLADLVVYDNEIVYDTDLPTEKKDDFDRRLVSVSRRVLYGHAVLLFVIAITAFVAGYLAGHFTKDDAVVQPQEAQRVLIDGRLQWEASTGLLADKGAVVIAVPENLEPGNKLSGEDLRPDNPMPPRNDALVKTIEDWGGDYKRTNDVGEFELFLKPGRYHILLVSKRAERPHNMPPAREHLAAIGRYFTSPELLVGPYRYRWKVEELDEGMRLSHDFLADNLE